MDKQNSLSRLKRTKSDQLVEAMAAALAGIKSASGDGGSGQESSGSSTMPSKSSRQVMASPGRNGVSHIRKTRSAQLRFDVDDLNSSAALSRASSASLGFSFSFTGFTPPADEIDNGKTFHEEASLDDIEAGRRKKKLQAESTLPIYLKFRDVSYKVVLKGMTSTVEKEILNGVTGSVDPGEVLALMGPSGSGKTTLLSVLGRRTREQIHGGSVTYNDQPYSKSLKSRIGFVTQDDVLFPHLTVKETLTYAARLRLPSRLTDEEKDKRAKDVIYKLGLERCQDTMIGGSFVRGVSGGERKRVCIGNEIIINPSLLLLDEPTSGLDSTTALRTVDILQDIAQDGKTVITTIHQPSSRLFLKFDKLILLGKGSLLYFGKASEAMVYFSSIGCFPLISMNPAEFMLDLANGNLTDISVPSELEDKVQTENIEVETPNGKPAAAVVHEVKRYSDCNRTDLERTSSFRARFANSFCWFRALKDTEHTSTQPEMKQKRFSHGIQHYSKQYLVETYETRLAENETTLTTQIPIDQEIKSKAHSTKREWGASWWKQYSILFCRGLKERRHDYFSWLRITQVLVTATILGLLWWQSGSNDPKELHDQAGLLFFIGVFWGFFPVFTAIFTFPQERAMLSKERAADMYRLSAYFAARTTSDLPLDLLLPLFFLLVVYFMAGLRMDAGSFFLTILAVFLCIIAAQGLGLAIGATLMDLKRATTLASVTVMTFMLAGGFFVKDVPVFISWLRYLSFNYHTYKLLLKVQYEHISHSVNGIEIDDGYKEVGALAAMIIGYRLLAYLSLRRMKLHPGA